MRYNHVHMGTCDVGCSSSWRHGARIGRAARNSRTFWTIRASITVRKKKNIRCFSKMDGAKQIIYWLNACSILIRWYLRHKCWHAWSCQIWGFVHQQIYGKKKRRWPTQPSFIQIPLMFRAESETIGNGDGAWDMTCGKLRRT
jgi:hypothetical protein